MAETIRQTQEFIQGNKYQMLDFRETLVGKATGLGPPDICILFKRYHSALIPQFGKGDAEETAYSHWVFGINNDSPHAIAGYVRSLLAEQPSVPWYGRGTYQITGAVYCTYDPFSGFDLRVEITLGSDTVEPSVVSYAVDAQGNKYKDQPYLWKQVFVASGLRCMVIPPSYIPCMRTSNSHLEDFEDQLLGWAAELLAENVRLTRGLPKELETQDPRDVETVQRIISQYLLQRNRFEDVVKFFTPLLNSRPVSSIPLSEAYKHLGSYRDGITMLLRSLRKDPLCSNLLVAQACALLEVGRPKLALPLAKTAVEQEPLSPECWVLLAKTYVRLRRPRRVLIALNGLPAKQPRTPESALEDLVVLPTDIPAKGLTQPPNRTEYAAPHEWFFYDMEKEHEELYPELYDGLDEDEDVERDENDPTMPSLRASALDEVSLRAYEIIVGLEQQLGWPRLVKTCKEIFFMEADESDEWREEQVLEQYEAERQRELEKEKEYRVELEAIKQRRLHEQQQQLGNQTESKEKQSSSGPPPSSHVPQGTSLADVAQLYDLTDQMGGVDDGSGLGFGPAFGPQYQISKNGMVSFYPQSSPSITPSGTPEVSRYSVESEPSYSELTTTEYSITESSIVDSEHSASQQAYMNPKFPNGIPETSEPLSAHSSTSGPMSSSGAPRVARSSSVQSGLSSMSSTQPASEAVASSLAYATHSPASVQSPLSPRPIPLITSPRVDMQKGPGSPASSVGSASTPHAQPVETKSSAVKASSTASSLTVPGNDQSDKRRRRRRHGDPDAGRIKKRMCSAWLRHLLEALYEDMSLLYAWHLEMDREQERKKQRAIRKAQDKKRRQMQKAQKQKKGKAPAHPSNSDATLSDLETGRRKTESKQPSDEESSDSSGSTDDSDSSTDSGSSSSEDDDSETGTSDARPSQGDTPRTRRKKKRKVRSMAAWIAYAEMAERLKRPADAETAYRNCLKQSRRCRRAWRGLLHLYTEHSYLRPALVAAGELVRLDGKKYPERNVGPKCVVLELVKLVGHFGLKKVIQAHDSIKGMGGSHNYLAKLYKRFVKWKVHGYDR